MTTSEQHTSKSLDYLLADDLSREGGYAAAVVHGLAAVAEAIRELQAHIANLTATIEEQAGAR